LLRTGFDILVDDEIFDDGTVSGSEKIHIPAQCREIKAWFWERPGSEIIEEIKRHVAETGFPHTWRGHTHNKPPGGGKPKYLDEFDLPEKLIRAKCWAPCPCCSPETPKYGLNGKIAWFPEEGVVRLLGPDCFKSLDAEGHEEAKRQLAAERQRKQDTEFLLSKLPLLKQVIRVGERAVPVAKALDAFRESLLAKFALAQLPLWEHVRHDGVLKVSVRHREFRPNSDGSMRVEEVDTFQTYARLNGHEILDPRLSSQVGRLQSALRRLHEFADTGEDLEQVKLMSDEEKRRVAGQISKAVSTIKTAVDKITALRRFTDLVTINTLRRWGEQEGCPLPRFFERRGDRIAFGQREHRNFVVEIPDDLLAEIGEVKF
jgi:hypothetical protein